jgi:molybdopterin-guanine dinucleotide biosynthesis protein A
MGRPKHLIRQGGRTWLERTVATLRAVAEQVVVVGQGELPVADLPRLPDVPGMAGPLAGLAAAMRWQPWASWLLVACDLPELDVAALEWLVAARRPGVWAVIPQLRPDFVEPLLAYYDFRIQPAVEELVRRGEQRIGRLAAAEKVAILTPPAQLWSAWRNVNYEHELDPVARLTGESGEGSV